VDSSAPQTFVLTVNAAPVVSIVSPTNGASFFAPADFTVLADTDQSVLNLYHATMGTTAVIDGGGVVRMNEDYKDGTKLRQTLESLP
jgi:hypothetical protein